MAKRNLLFYSLFIIVINLSLISSASFDFNLAQTTVTKVLDSILGILSPILEKIVGDYSSSEFFFAKVLLLILLIIVINGVLDKTPIGDNKKINILISVIVSIIAIRYIGEEGILEAILIQYGALGIALTTIIPMIIFFYFVHNTKKIGNTGRRIFWILYGSSIIFLWLSKSSEISSAGNMIYIITLIAVIVFIIFDKKIHAYFGFSDFKKFERKTNRNSKMGLRKKIRELKEARKEGDIDEKEYIEEMKELRKRWAELSKET